MSIERLCVVVLIGAAVLASVPSIPGSLVSAHHAAAGYARDSDSVVRLEGVVVEFRWRNPHVVLVWDVTDASGTVVRWRGELASPSSMTGRAGMNRTSLKPGDPVEVYAFPALRGTPQSIPIRILSDGRMLLEDNVRGGGTVFEN
jgi:hypothetical protein